MTWKQNPFGIVIERTMRADFAALKGAGASFAIVDAGTGWDTNPAFGEQYTGAIKAGLPVLVQYTTIPAVDDYTFEAPGKEQVEVLKKLLGTRVPSGLIISVERYWTGWDVEQNHLPVHTATSAAINFTAETLVRTFTKHFAANEIPVLVRSNDKFVQTYCKDMSAWTDQFGFVLADWRYRTRAPDGTYSVYTIYKTEPTPIASIAQLRAAMPPDGSKNPLVPGNTPQLKIWEYSGNRYILPMVTGWDGKEVRVKVALFNGDEAAMKTYLKIDVAPVPTDPGEPGTRADLSRVIEILDRIAGDVAMIRQDVSEIRKELQAV